MKHWESSNNTFYFSLWGRSWDTLQHVYFSRSSSNQVNQNDQCTDKELREKRINITREVYINFETTGESQSLLKNDIIEKVIKNTVDLYPFLTHNLRTVNHFYKKQFDKILSPKVYICDLAKVSSVHSMRKLGKLKGKSSGTVIHQLNSVHKCMINIKRCMVRLVFDIKCILEEINIISSNLLLWFRVIFNYSYWLKLFIYYYNTPLMEIF